jgi:uncharacterized repeat protein (TIGR01451 family)
MKEQFSKCRPAPARVIVVTMILLMSVAGGAAGSVGEKADSRQPVLLAARNPFDGKPMKKKSPASSPASGQKPAENATGSPKPSRFEGGSGSWRLTLLLPAEVTLGDEFATELRLTAAVAVTDFKLRVTVTSGAVLVRSEPAATLSASEGNWELGNLGAGESRLIKLTLRAEQEGPVTLTAVSGDVPGISARTTVGKPVLSLEQTVPETALLGADVTCNLVLKNVGTAVARTVRVINPVPQGLRHASGKTELAYEVGELAPGQGKPLTVTLKANQRGKICNTAAATAANAARVTANGCVLIQVPGLKVEKTGAKEQVLGRNADYEIVVSNPGDTVLNNVVVSDQAAAETSIVAAPGARLEGNRAIWTIATLAPGTRTTHSLKLTSKLPGTHCAAVTVTARGLSETAKTCTLWKGIAGVGMQVSDDPDPIQIGELSTYTIKIINQGFADIHNIAIQAQFGEQIAPVSSPQATLSGNQAIFPVVAALGPKQSVTCTVTVKGTSVGDSRSRVRVQADELTSPIEATESTTVY